MPDELLSKDNGKSIIPPNSLIERFTVSFNKISSFKSINNQFLNYPHANNTYISIKRIKNFQAEQYWPYIYEINESNKYDQSDRIHVLSMITDFIKNNDHLGLGLSIEYNGKAINYRFDFKFISATLYKEENGSLIPKATASIKNGWKWTTDLSD